MDSIRVSEAPDPSSILGEATKMPPEIINLINFGGVNLFAKIISKRPKLLHN